MEQRSPAANVARGRCFPAGAGKPLIAAVRRSIFDSEAGPEATNSKRRKRGSKPAADNPRKTELTPPRVARACPIAQPGYRLGAPETA
jgi:hypothetical protein